MNIYEINPYLRRKMASVLPPYRKIKNRIIFDYELIYIEKGNLIFTYAGQEYRCDAGQFIFIRPAIEHSLKCSAEDVSQPHIHFDFYYTEQSPIIPISFKNLSDMSEYEKSLITEDIFTDYPIHPFITFSDKDKFLQFFYELIESNNSDSLLHKKSLLIKLIDMIITDNFPGLLSTHKNEEYNVVRELKDFIDSNQGTTMSLEDLEKQFYYSKFYLEKQFKKLYGQSLISYRNDKKMELAKKLLKNKNVSAVASKLGYSSIYSFSRAFKTHFGEPPSSFKQKT